MPLSLPKRYIRSASYAFVFILVIIVILRLQTSWSLSILIPGHHLLEEPVFGNWTIDDKKLALTVYDFRFQRLPDKAFGKVDFNAEVILDVSTQNCVHLTKGLEWCLRPVWNTNILKDDLEVSERIVKKDIRGSYGYDWYGRSEYLIYKTATIGNLLAAGVDSPYIFHIATSSEVLGNNLQSVHLHGMYFNFIETSILDIVWHTMTGRAGFIYSSLDLLFGEGCADPRPHWKLLPYSPFVSEYRIPVYLSIGGQALVNLKKSEQRLLYDMERETPFKIVQLADLHIGVGENECLDEYPQKGDCHADPKTLHFVDTVLDIESPDFVVFSGDQIMGDRSVQDSETALLKVLQPVISRSIPWAMIWGNHDDEGSLTRWQLSEMVSKLPFSTFQFSPYDTQDNTFGVGNYVQQVFSKQDPKKSLMTFYFLDSHKYSQNPRVYSGYDWIKEAQWEYLEELYETELSKTFADKSKHISMAFFHIPLPEYLNFESKQNPGQSNPLVGNVKEGVTAPKYNSGGLSVLNKLGVKVTSCGHDHCNDYCLQDDSTGEKIWLCYAGGAGEGGYGGYGGTERRIRVYSLDPKTGSVFTWKRLNGSPEESFDYQQLV